MYQDPEGTRSLEQSDHPEITNKITVTVHADDNNYYKQRILTLNEEIKALNKEVAMVTQLHLIFHYCVCLNVFPLVKKWPNWK